MKQFQRKERPKVHCMKRAMLKTRSLLAASLPLDRGSHHRVEDTRRRDGGGGGGEEAKEEKDDDKEEEEDE